MIPLVDMALSDKEKQAEMSEPMATDAPKYPYGLSIRLTHEELCKLDVDCDSLEIGGLYHIVGMAKVTSISKRDTEDGADSNVEMQLVMLGVESEDDETESAPRPKFPKASMMYNN